MTQRFKDRVFIITGAGGGIGGSIARRLAAEGAALVLSDLNRGALDLLASEISAVGSRPESLALDAADPNLGRRLGEMALEKFGRIDGFVPMAGIVKFKPVVEFDPAQWDAVMNINLRGVFFGIQSIGRMMIEGGFSGSIVTASSTSGEGPRPDCADYAASKAGVNHITRTFALQFAPQGIRVNAISPGVIDTPMWREVDRGRGAILGLKPGELLAKMKSEIPMGRIGSPDDVASLVAFLLSDESTYVTGQIITIDGGYRLNHP
jgi:meso-butanediol dehydrogenase / (S,S)-butanediol dehydrogenase / diacetyl reductase